MRVEPLAVPYVVSSVYQMYHNHFSSDITHIEYIKSGNKVTAVAEVFKTYDRKRREVYTVSSGQFIDVMA